jgi:hypothetical protein
MAKIVLRIAHPYLSLPVSRTISGKTQESWHAL